MINKEDYICTTPFRLTEIHDTEQYLCCPSWLKTNIWDGKSIESSFKSKKAKKVRQSILDGNYKYCDEIVCPYLSGLKRGKFNPIFVKKNKKTLEYYKNTQEIKTVNFCFDRSCNYQCPSCRQGLINYYGKDRDNVEKKLKEVNDILSDKINTIYLSGSADPFYSKSFRKFLQEFKSSKFPNMYRIHIHTNGSLWTQSMWDTMKEVQPFVKTCEVSIDAATKDTYENKTRIGGKWDTLLENLKFITNIKTIEWFCFSFVVQDTNYKEMYDFYKLIESYFIDKDVTWEVKFTQIINWKTFTDEEYKLKTVHDSEHKEHHNFMNELDRIKDLPKVVHNFSHLTKNEKQII